MWGVKSQSADFLTAVNVTSQMKADVEQDTFSNLMEDGRFSTEVTLMGSTENVEAGS